MIRDLTQLAALAVVFVAVATLLLFFFLGFFTAIYETVQVFK